MATVAEEAGVAAYRSSRSGRYNPAGYFVTFGRLRGDRPTRRKARKR
jgi:hypothetical protein